MFWWTCSIPGCFDRMTADTDPRQVERDRDAHLATKHAGQPIAPHLLRLSYWASVGVW